MNAPSSASHKNQKVERAHMSITRGIDKQIVVYSYSKRLFHHGKERSSNPCYSVDAHAKWTNADTRATCCGICIFMNCPGQINPETQNTVWWRPGAGGREKKKKKELLNGYMAFLWSDRNVSDYTVAVAAQHCDLLNATELFLVMVGYMLCDSHLNYFVFKSCN